MEESWHFGDRSATPDLGAASDDSEFQFVMRNELSQEDAYPELVELLHFVPHESVAGQPSNWRLVPVRKDLSFDHGTFLTVRAIQALRERNKAPVLVGIGGPSGSGKSSLARRVASVLGGAIIALENYYDPRKVKDDNIDNRDSFDFSLLLGHLKDVLANREILVPVFDFQEKRRVGSRRLIVPASGVVLLEGVYALHAQIRDLLALKVAVVGGVHYNLMTKVCRDLKNKYSMERIMEVIFPFFKTFIEPDLENAEVKISNPFVSSSLRDPCYIAKSDKQVSKEAVEMALNAANKPFRTERVIDMYLRPPGQATRPRDWIRVRQLGIRYFIMEGDQRIIDKNIIVRPQIEFEAGNKTLGGLLYLGYNVEVSFKREREVLENEDVSVSLETIDDLGVTFTTIKGRNREAVLATATALALQGSFLSKSFRDMVMEKKGIPRLPSPPLQSPGPAPPPPLGQAEGSSAGVPPAATSATLPAGDAWLQPPRPVVVRRGRNGSGGAGGGGGSGGELWTRSPPRARDAAPVESWYTTGDAAGSSADEAGAQAGGGGLRLPSPSEDAGVSGSKHTHVELVPRPECCDFDRGLVLAVQGVQTLLNTNGPPVILGIGGPSGSGKTSLADNMAKIIGCEVVSMDHYCLPDAVNDANYDDFSTLDVARLLQNLRELKELQCTRVPIFDFRQSRRIGSREIAISEEAGVVIIEGVYALHPAIRDMLDLRIAVVGGVHSHLVARVHRDLVRAGREVYPRAVMQKVFPTFKDCIEPQLLHAHLRIENNFDPVHATDNSLFVLKSSKQVAMEDIVRVLNPRGSPRIQNFTDIFFYLRGAHANGPSSDSDFIRVRNCEGRFAILIREPIRDGDYIIQPRVDFDISSKTLAGLFSLGYHPAALIEGTATIYQNEKLIVEVDHLARLPRPYIQIKGLDKEAVASLGRALQLEGTYTTMPYIEIIHESNKVALAESTDADHSPQAARLVELVHRVKSQEILSSSPTREASPSLPGLSHVLQALALKVDRQAEQIRSLERAITTNTVVIVMAVATFLCVYLYEHGPRLRFREVV